MYLRSVQNGSEKVEQGQNCSTWILGSVGGREGGRGEYETRRDVKCFDMVGVVHYDTWLENGKIKEHTQLSRQDSTHSITHTAQCYKRTDCCFHSYRMAKRKLFFAHMVLYDTYRAHTHTHTQRYLSTDEDKQHCSIQQSFSSSFSSWVILKTGNKTENLTKQ